MKALLDYPSLVAGAADALEPHRVANYLHDTAGKIHLWYHKAHVLNEPEPIMRARLVLARASQLVLAERARAAGHHGAGANVSAREHRPARHSATEPTSNQPLNDRSRRRLRRARLGRNAVRKSRQRARRLGHVLLRVGEPPRARAARRRDRQRLSDRQAEEGVRVAADRPRGTRAAEGASFRWRGRYRHDLNMAETLETHLGVFSNFRPKIPEQFRNAPFVFLGNIDPRLQLEVLTQVSKPQARRLRHDELLDREPAAGHARAARARRPDHAQRRRGAAAHRGVQPRARRRDGSWSAGRSTSSSRRASTARSCSPSRRIFFAPAYPLESVFDPTGAGDSFAGGFMGYLAQQWRPLRGEPAARRRLRLGDGIVRRREVLGRAPARDHAGRTSKRRVADFHRLVSFEQDVA